MSAWDPRLVSVVVPVFNGERFLREALESILGQDYRPLEVLVVDDGSTDRSGEIAREFPAPVRLLRQANQGPATARNYGAASAAGEMIAFLDADDLWLPGKLGKQVALLAAQGGGYVVCRFHPHLVDGISWPAGLNRAYYESDPPGFVPSGLLVTRQAWAAVGPFDPSFRISDDSDWFFRARKLGIPEGLVPEVLVHKRIHGQNISHGTMASELLRGLRNSLHRGRGQ